MKEFKNFYEDEESLLMLNKIRKQHDDLKNKKNKTNKLQNIGIAILIIIFIALFIWILKINNDIQNTFIRECQLKGHTYNYCVSKS